MLTNNRVVTVRKDGTKRVAIFFDQVDPETGEVLNPSLTKQSFKRDSDINVILGKYGKEQLLDHLAAYNGQYGNYGDFSEVIDFHGAMNKVIAAEDMFMSLPATLRKEFANDPGLFLDQINDPSQRERMVKLGLIKPEFISPTNFPPKEGSEATESTE